MSLFRRLFSHGAIPAIVLKLAAFRVVAHAGAFFAISDDDFSRLTIAQSYAASAKLDPSGTSWLPLPFHVYGTCFAAFGNRLAVAEALALLIALLGALGVHTAARWAGLREGPALWAALLAAALPHSLAYGLATVPDYPTAVLALLAATSLANRAPGVRLLGAVAALAATLCRYETWPLALVLTAFALRDWHREEAATRRALLAAACIAPAGALMWMLHGVVHHHDAWFFIKRVTAYKRALGGPTVPLLERLLTQPVALFRGEPELVLVAVVLLLTALFLLGKHAFTGDAWKRPALALGAVLTFLVLGDARDGSPTHHGERVLLSLWFGLSLLVPPLFLRVRSALLTRQRVWAKPWAPALPLGLLVAATAGCVRPWVAFREPFVDRSAELALGTRLASLLPEGHRVAVYTEDYGYFAVDAALGRPGILAPLIPRDPRHPEPDPLRYPARLTARLASLGTRFFVVPAPHRTQASAVGFPIDQIAGFSVYLQK